MIEELLGEAPKDWQKEASKIPVEELAAWLREMDWLVIQPGLWIDPDYITEDVTRANPLYVIDQKTYHEDFVEKEDLKIRLSGSIRDLELEEAVREAYDKHNWRLAEKIADLI